MPSSVLQLMHQRRPRPAIYPADGSATADERRKQIAPGASTRPQGVTTALAPRSGERDEAIPAVRTGETPIRPIVEAPADDAGARKQQIHRRVRPFAPGANRDIHSRTAVLNACRITSRGA